jgi:hypothetical protein
MTEPELKPLIVKCPHCCQLCEVLELNCRIFRCGIYKHNFVQIPPHLPKIQCDYLKANNLIFGCGKPFKLIYNSDKSLVSVICGYI